MLQEFLSEILHNAMFANSRIQLKHKFGGCLWLFALLEFVNYATVYTVFNNF